MLNEGEMCFLLGHSTAGILGSLAFRSKDRSSFARPTARHVQQAGPLQTRPLKHCLLTTRATKTVTRLQRLSAVGARDPCKPTHTAFLVQRFYAVGACSNVSPALRATVRKCGHFTSPDTVLKASYVTNIFDCGTVNTNDLT